MGGVGVVIVGGGGGVGGGGSTATMLAFVPPTAVQTALVVAIDP